MKLLDSNILIYAPLPQYQHLRNLLIDPDCLVSEVTRLEVLGFHRLTTDEKEYYEMVFSLKTVLPISKEIIDLAIEFRQSRKLTLGDAICAATAVNYDLELLTRNLTDFKHIPGLKLSNPV